MKLIRELNQIKNKIGLVSGRLKINEYDNFDKNISASINTQSWDIEISLSKDFEPIQDETQEEYVEKKRIQNAKHTILEDILYHELAHWELAFNSGYGCPFNSYYHDLILESVKMALPADKKSHTNYVANAFEDLMINPRCREFKKDFSGHILFWDHEGLRVKEATHLGYTPFFEAFVKLNMHLFGEEADKELLSRHYLNSEQVEKAVEIVVKELNLPENIQNTTPLFIKGNWQRMASLFAKNLSDLLEVDPTERLSAFSGNVTEDKSEPSGNGVEQKMYTKEGKEEIAFERYKHNQSLSSNIDKFEQLDSLYQRLSRAIPINVEAITKESSLNIAPLNYRPFNDEIDSIIKAKISKLYFTEDGLTVGHPKYYLTVTEKYKIQRRSFPDFKMIILDSSGSMSTGINGSEGNTTYIPWGDNSKYHYALLGFYGIEQFLQSQGIAQYISHGLSLFSTSTRYEESNFVNIKQIRRMALSPDFGGDTRIDANILLNSLKGSGNFVLSLSDGEIFNWSSAKTRFLELSGQNYFAHIQIGSSTKFTQDLEENGFPVFYVTSGDDLSKLMVNVATDTYKRFTRI